MKITIICLITCFFVGKSCSQNSLSVGFGGFRPFGDFASQLSDAQPGAVSIHFGHAIKKSPLWQWGLDLGIVMYAYREYDVTFVPKGQSSSTIATVNEDDCMVQYGGNVHYQFWTKRTLLPYGMANFGVNRFFSHIDPLDANAGYESQFKWQGTALYGGLGAGVRMNVNKLFGNPSPKRMYFFDLGTSWNAGSKAGYRYFKNDEAPHENLTYGVHKTNTSFRQTSLTFGLIW